jgi:hypothetical protein
MIYWPFGKIAQFSKQIDTQQHLVSTLMHRIEYYLFSPYYYLVIDTVEFGRYCTIESRLDIHGLFLIGKVISSFGGLQIDLQLFFHVCDLFRMIM